MTGGFLPLTPPCDAYSLPQSPVILAVSCLQMKNGQEMKKNVNTTVAPPDPVQPADSAKDMRNNTMVTRNKKAKQNKQKQKTTERNPKLTYTRPDTAF